MELAEAIQQIGGGQKVWRLTLFDQLRKAPDSGASRQLITNSSKYGLTSGGYQAEYLELTPNGKIATDPEASARERLRARFNLAIEGVPPFSLLYEKYKNGKLPGQAIIRDALLDAGYGKDEISECVDTFIVNAKFLGILKPISGVERVLTLDHALDDVPAGGSARPTGLPTPESAKPSVEVSGSNWDAICFYVTPIGNPDSDERRHSDLFLGSIIEPAIEELGLTVVRADQIGKPGMITAQVIEHVMRSKLVIADLSFHNPNVFYELSLRHACGLPTVQVIRSSDRIPFDLDQFRTIQIDTSSIYALVPQLATYRSEIATQARRVLDDPLAVDNPLTVFAPGIKVILQ